MAISDKRNKTLLSVLAAITVGVLLFATALAVGKSMKQKDDYVSAAQRLALHDLSDAVLALEEAAKAGDVPAMNRAAGKAEAYLSRSGIKNCGSIYSLINGICNGEYDTEMSERLSRAVGKAIEGDGGEALRSLYNTEETSEVTSEETTEDMLTSRMLKRIGRGSDDIAEKRARSFACLNAVFDECETDKAKSYLFSGDNIFVAVEGESSRVTMYCFDRDTDERYSVPPEEAAHTVNMIVKKEKLRLPSQTEPILDSGIYRFVYTDPKAADTPVLIFEIYADTGRLRKYDAVNYYKSER